MKKISLIFAGAVVCLCICSLQSSGQTGGDVSATVQFSNGDSVSVTDFSNSVTLQPNEVVNVTIQFTASDVGEMFKVEAPDGGSVGLGNSVVVVGENRTIIFAFRASDGSGQNAITVQSASKSFSLQFSVGGSSGG